LVDALVVVVIFLLQEFLKNISVMEELVFRHEDFLL
jgi:hypothetical protein